MISNRLKCRKQNSYWGGGGEEKAAVEPFVSLQNTVELILWDLYTVES